MARGSSRLSSFQPHEDLAEIPNDEHLLIIAIKFQRRTAWPGLSHRLSLGTSLWPGQWAIVKNGKTRVAPFLSLSGRGQ